MVANVGYKGSGLAPKDEVKWRLLQRDTRTIAKKIYDFFESPKRCAMFVILLTAVSFFFSPLADVFFLIGLFVFKHGLTRELTLPFRLPMRSHKLDLNDPKPGGKSPQMARGIYFFGNDISTKEELWFTNDEMRTHGLMLGTTGSGKTEALISIAYNALVQGSGFIYVDGKGDNTLFAKIFSLARSVGREDDILLINFMTGAKDIIGPQRHRLSNTLNPFSHGSSGMLSQLIVSLMPASSKTPDGDMWKGRAIAFVEALLKILVYMRDQGKILLDINLIRQYFNLNYLEQIVVDKVFPRVNDEPISLADAPPVVIEPLYNYVMNLPGYDKSKKGQQVSQVLEQHGFITMQLVRVFTSLADTYGHIVRTNLAEVDLKDVVLNRRILIVLLPALEKAPDELSNLGKVIIATLKAMMAAGLGESVEGTYKDLIQRKPTNATTPFLCILDEYGYYAVQGFAIVPAQARSLGFSVIFAGQDLASFQRASKEETETIWANTTIKMAMRLEDNETIKRFQNMAGQQFVALSKSFEAKPQSLVFHYRDASKPGMEKMNRISGGEIRKQRQGEVIFVVSKSICRARIFHANPKPVSSIRLNHFLRIESPPLKKLIELEKMISRFAELVKTGDLFCERPEPDSNIDFVNKILREDSSPTFIERGVSALMALYNRETKAEEEFEAEGAEEVVVEAEEGAKAERVEEAEFFEGKINVFTKAVPPELSREFVPENEWEAFSDAFLYPKPCKKHIRLGERLSGKSESYAQRVADELVKDMESASYYPPEISLTVSPDEMMASLNAIVEALDGMRGE